MVNLSPPFLLISLRLKESPALAAKALHKFDQTLYEAENLETDPGAGRVSGTEAALWQVNIGFVVTHLDSNLSQKAID